MGARLKRCCQPSPVSQLEADRTQQNSLEAESMTGQGLIRGCSARGWIDQSTQINTNFSTNGNTP